MQITVISDTHGLHDRITSLNKPFINKVDGAGKMIIHAGDITEDGTEAEVWDFLGGLPNCRINTKYSLGATTICFWNKVHW